MTISNTAAGGLDRSDARGRPADSNAPMPLVACPVRVEGKLENFTHAAIPLHTSICRSQLKFVTNSIDANMSHKTFEVVTA